MSSDFMIDDRRRQNDHSFLRVDPAIARISEQRHSIIRERSINRLLARDADFFENKAPFRSSDDASLSLSTLRGLDVGKIREIV